MKFEKSFRLVSYAVVLCAFASLWLSGTFGVIETTLFLGVVSGAWFLEDSKYQVSERFGTALIVLALPAYYLAWKFRFFDFATTETMLAGILARLILTLTAIKLLQRKADRDWIFLYLMAFFEVLLAAGLSISSLYFGSFVAYVFLMACAVILFEIRKTRRQIGRKLTLGGNEISPTPSARMGRIPLVAFGLITGMIALALPMFFMLPRVGGAGLGGSGGVTAVSGFSERVRLGGVGPIQQNDAVVMRVRLDGSGPGEGDIRWRGVAFDTFDGQAWSRSRTSREQKSKGDRELIRVDYASGRQPLTSQTIYLEPIDTPILFVLPRAVAVQGSFSIVERDWQGALSTTTKGERTSYRVFSDQSQPSETELRSDGSDYGPEAANYLQLSEALDPRISLLAGRVIGRAANRYDAARAVESYLQNRFGYTLEQKAGGPDPLADFLFNVREGHCEYFATAMAVMLRSQGIAARVVNGFQRGEYNETADVYVVRQRNAHSWVEVYFPGEDTWITFDPTPAAGRNLTGPQAGIAAQLNKYLEALEMFWIQYFVAFDDQEQRSLFTSVRRGVAEYGAKTNSMAAVLKERLAEWWRDARGDKGIQTSMSAIGYAVVYSASLAVLVIGCIWVGRRIARSRIWQSIANRVRTGDRTSIVEFYERMLVLLASKGIVREPHQTPLEFAYATNLPEVVKITGEYNRVRFGERRLTTIEATEIEDWLKSLSERRSGPVA